MGPSLPEALPETSAKTRPPASLKQPAAQPNVYRQFLQYAVDEASTTILMRPPGAHFSRAHCARSGNFSRSHSQKFSSSHDTFSPQTKSRRLP
jgi:hypothetical protein